MSQKKFHKTEYDLWKRPEHNTTQSQENGRRNEKHETWQSCGWDDKWVKRKTCESKHKSGHFQTKDVTEAAAVAHVSWVHIIKAVFIGNWCGLVWSRTLVTWCSWGWNLKKSTLYLFPRMSFKWTPAIWPLLANTNSRHFYRVLNGYFLTFNGGCVISVLYLRKTGLCLVKEAELVQS